MIYAHRKPNDHGHGHIHGIVYDNVTILGIKGAYLHKTIVLEGLCAKNKLLVKQVPRIRCKTTPINFKRK